YVIDAAATGTNTGSVTVKGTAVIWSGGHIDGNGTNTVEAGGTVYFNAAGTGTPFVGGSGSSAVFAVTTGAFSYKNDSYIVQGDVTYNGVWNDPIDEANQTLTIKKGGKLTIPGGGKALRLKSDSVSASAIPIVVGDLSGTGTVPQIVVTNNNGLYFDRLIDINCYIGSTRETTNFVTAGTYTWTADVGGAGIDGWKAP
ncbi:MAG: hypothetical protein LBB78_07525, partial [Spirochaetaceae bacterium]|nr:hypothetical protein [Spirochaetaceae bacterium]